MRPLARIVAAIAFLPLLAACGAAGHPIDDEDGSVGVEEGNALTQGYPVGTVLKATTNVWLRKSASTSGAQIDLIEKGETVTVASSTPSNGFLKVQASAGLGWSYGSYYVRVSGPPASGGASGAGGASSGTATVATITNLAAASSCYAYQWKDRGQAPKGYVKGVALVYARAVCNAGRSDVAVVSKANTGDDANDAISWFDSNFDALSMSNDAAGVDTLRHAYTLLLGLGMRESSGEHCVGRDASATNTSSESAEAGAWQTSYDSRTRSVELPKLFAKYQADPSGCLLSTFAEGVSCSSSDWKNWGSGADGLTYQKMNKECPAFAAEYAAVMLRVNGGTKGHYGPLRTKAAEIRPECDQMLQKVQAIVEQNPALCASL